jgi:hypothetical protein
MPRAARTTRAAPRSTAGRVRARIDGAPGRLWRITDFTDLPVAAVAQALSRLAREGFLERQSKGLYFRPRPTALGPSRPNPADAFRLVRERTPVFPAGIAAANLLGFTTQAAGRREVATTATSLPRKLIGEETLVHTRRPPAWARLSESDGALLDFLRHAGRTGELAPEATLDRTMKLLTEDDRFDRLLKAAPTEPPRVRALLGALGEQLGRPVRDLDRLRRSLNPLSRFDFGAFAGLPNARAWQARPGG